MLLFLFALFVWSSNAVLNQTHQAVLDQLANNSWLVNNTCYSPRCTASGGYIVALNLSDIKSSNTPVPAYIGDLGASLQSLDLRLNQLDPTIPANFSALTGLQTLILTGNYIETIPNWIENLTSLITLDLSDNELNGTLPSNITNLHNLQTLT